MDSRSLRFWGLYRRSGRVYQTNRPRPLSSLLLTLYKYAMTLTDRDFENFLSESWQTNRDSAHDFGHVRRVVALALQIGCAEDGDAQTYVPAAWLHDLVNLPKDHPQRSFASRLSAEKASGFLQGAGYDPDRVEAIAHAIAAHSFSAGIPPRTLEAKIVQDADRLESLGAIGIARTFAVSGALGRALFHPHDPLARMRSPDDIAFGLDHFEIKLFRIAETMQTETGRAIAAQRVAFMRDFREQMAAEIACATM